MTAFTASRKKFADYLALNEELAKLNILQKRRTFLKILIIGFFLYRDIEIQRRNLLERKKELVAELRDQIENYFQTLKLEINNEITTDEMISQQRESKLLDYIDEFSKAINSLKQELANLDENGQISNFEIGNLSSYLKYIDQIKNQIISHNHEIEVKRLNSELSKLKPHLFEAQHEFDNFFFGNRYFSKKNLHYWKSKYNQLVADLQTIRGKAAQLGVDLEEKSRIDKLIEEYKHTEATIRNAMKNIF